MENFIRRYVHINDLLLVGTLFVALGLAWSTVAAMQRNYRLQQHYDSLQAEVDLMELENQNLKYSITYLQSDGYLELAARDKFGKAESGETLVHLPDTGEKLSPVAKSQPRNPVDKQVVATDWRTNIQMWWHFLRGRESPTGVEG